jgi:NADPH:quinone reductase-like Zn-dependent oxidoreductase
VAYADLRVGETLVVIGVGGVGGAAVEIGRWIGARVIGLARRAPHPESPAARMAERIVTPDVSESAAVIHQLTAGRGADVVLNTVGGATFEASLAMLAPRGRLAILASPGERRQGFDLVDFYHNESQLFGVDTLRRDMTDSAALLEALTPGFEDGTFQPPVIDREVPLEQAVEAYRAVAAGARGRIVLVPGPA